MCALIHLARHPGRALASLSLAVLACFLAASAADPPARGPTFDAALAGQASAALAADPELAGLNLIVDVVHGSAEVGGPVPRPELARRIEEVLKTVPGLTSSRVTVWVPTPKDPLSKLVGEALRADATQRPAEQAKRPPVPPLVIVPNPEPPTAPPALALRAEPGPTADPARVTVQRIPAIPGNRLLLDPVSPSGVPLSDLPMPAPAAAVGRTYPTIPPPSVPAVPVGRGAEGGVAALRASDPRFVGLTVEVRGGTATIGGTAHRVADAWDLAAAVRRVPGVERVVIGDVVGW